MQQSAPQVNPEDWLRHQRHWGSRRLRIAIALATVSGGLLIVQAWLLARATDLAVLEHLPLESLMPWLWPFLAILVLRTGLIHCADRFALQAALQIKTRLRSELLDHIRSPGPAREGVSNSGELASHLSDGIEALEPYFARFIPTLSLAAVIPSAILAFVLPVDWVSGLVMLITAPLIPVFMILIGTRAERLNQQQWQTLTRMSGHFLDNLQGLTTLKLFDATRREARLMEQISAEYRVKTMAVLRVAFLSSLALEFLASVSIALVAVFIGFRLLWGELDFATGFFVLLLAPEFYLPLRQLGTHYHARMQAVAAAGPLLTLMERQSDDTAIKHRTLPGPASLRVHARQLHVAYGNQIVLNGIDFELRPGETLAVVGPSGAGKTTLARVVLGLVEPHSGEVQVNGIALSELNPVDWRSHVAWVPQNPRLFHGSIGDNISMWTEASPERLIAAARLAHAEDFIERLPDGLDTQVGERGQGLSGGEIQRIALARAFFKQAPLVILDEPSASLDPRSESLLQRATRRLAADRTLLVIAHRLSTVRWADRILVMDQGRMVQTGSHRQLCSREGLYRRMLPPAGAGQ